MGILSNLFTKELAFVPSTWLRAISNVQEDGKASIDRCTFSSGYEKDLKELVQILQILLEKYDEIQKASHFSPHKLYSIRVPRGLCDRMIELSLKPLSDEDLSQVRGGPGAQEFHQQLFRENPDLHQKLFRIDPPGH